MKIAHQDRMIERVRIENMLIQLHIVDANAGTPEKNGNKEETILVSKHSSKRNQMLN